MSKKGLRLFLAVILAVLLQSAVLTTFASSLEPEENLQLNTEPETQAGETLPSQSMTQETTEEIIPADFPALTVNVISNYFPSANAEYSVSKKEITVTYWLHMSKDLLTTQWYLSYDPEVLEVSPEKNTPESICPSIGKHSVISFEEKDKIHCTASNIALFDFSSEMKPFAQIVFDVKELDPDEPITTKIDLTVDVLRVSERNKQTGYSDPEKETLLVSNCDVVPAEGLISVRSDRTTTLTKSSFVQATTAEPSTAPWATDSSGNTIPATSDEPGETTYPAVNPTDGTGKVTKTDPAASTAVVDPSNPDDGDKSGAVGTGTPGYSFLALGILAAATSALFIMRKKGILY